MRIALYSDLHTEIKGWEPPTLDVEVVILAGDIGAHTLGLRWAARCFGKLQTSPTILYVAGNHEYYDTQLGLLAELQKPKWATSGVQFLERRAVELEGVRFLGCTLWTSFHLYGPGAEQALAMAAARRNINDYWMIRAKGGQRLEPCDTIRLHRAAVRWLDTELSKPFDGKTVVITHFAPHRGCVAPQHEGKECTPYFVTDLAWLMEKHRIDVWCYGHTHTNNDFVAENGCRVISNQLGYPRERGDNGFRANLVIEL